VAQVSPSLGAILGKVEQPPLDVLPALNSAPAAANGRLDDKTFFPDLPLLVKVGPFTPTSCACYMAC
jgi:hypothetical protein